MYKFLQRVFSTTSRHVDEPPRPAGSGRLTVADRGFDFATRARWHEGIPHPDWDEAQAWLETLPEPLRSTAWLELERCWLDWLRGSVGLHYRLFESDTALLLTAQSERQAQLKLDYLGATLRRIRRALEEIADHEPDGKQILLAFADEDDYYRYISGFYPEEGTFGMSAGMHLGSGCGHFVTHGRELEKLEPTIVHEMTHSCVAHLPLPLWLNEGLAQAIERRFAPTYEDPIERLARLRKLEAFWTPATIQEFWSGHAFHRPDDRQEMAYALALTLASVFAQDWSRFKDFVRHASHEDAGSLAAQQHLELDLGEALKESLRRSEGDWDPRPDCWEDIVETPFTEAPGTLAEDEANR